MWLITGPFDDEYGDGPPPQKTKLLKTGRQYTIGRRDYLLNIKSKAISKGLHATLEVGECTEEQAADPSFVPTLTLHNPADRHRVVERPTLPKPRLKALPFTPFLLESEDVIHLSASVPVQVRWEPICCYNGGARAGPSLSAKDCASLGVHLVPTLHPAITHHLTPTYTPAPALATSLLSLATLVKPEWLAAVLAAGFALPGELAPLEETFALPPTTKFRPTFAPALPPGLKKFAVWEPDEARVGFFRAHRFVFAGERGAEAPSALKEMVRRAEGEYECFAVEGGLEKLRKVLAKGRARGAELVLVADRHAVVPAVGEAAWAALVEEAKNFDLKFIAPESVVEAVLYVDISYVDSSSSAEEPIQESILPDVIPNTIEDEPSIPPPTAPRPSAARPRSPSPVPDVLPEEAPKRRLPRRAASRASSRAPSPPPEEDKREGSAAPESSQPRRTLVRRAGRPKPAIDVDDTTMDISADSASIRPSEEPAPRPNPVVPPTPGRSSRLKRRAGTAASTAQSQLFPDSALVPDSDADAEAGEPPLKKFRALFDQSDPDRVAAQSLADYGSQRESATQYEPSLLMSGSGSGTGMAPMAVVMEEEEESTLATDARGSHTYDQSQTQTQARGTKRKSQRADRDVDMEDGEDAPPRTRRRTSDEPAEPTQTQAQARSKPLSEIVTRVDMAHEPVHVKSKPPSKKPPTSASSSSKTGAPPGEPDKDAAFLKAVASKKRGKKTEDTFDREFNNLRISKPDLDREREAESDKWGVLEEFGDDGDVRGNFMVVMEMPVFREAGNGGGASHLRRGEGRLEWQGRPDFKKFRRKTTGEQRQPVELVVEEEGDLGIGSQYWKGASQAPPTSQPYSRSQSQPKMEEDSDFEKTTTQRSTQRSSKARRPKLVADDDEDDDIDSVAAAAPPKPASRSKSQAKKSQASKPAASQRAGRGSQKQPLFIDSDIEEMDEDAEAGAGAGGGGLDSDFGGGLGSDDDDEGARPTATLRSNATRGGTTQGSAAAGRGTKRRAPTVVDDDSDDGATFKAFGARTRSRKR